MRKFMRETMAATREDDGLQVAVLLILCWGVLPMVFSQETWKPVLTSTESTVTLQFAVELNAQSYVVTWHRTQGFFLVDQLYQAPFNNTKITFTVQDLYPGVSYTFLIFKNGNTSADRVYKQDIATVPLPPENVHVTGRTSSSVLLKWEPGHNSSQTGYQVEYQESGGSQTAAVNWTSLQYNLTGLLPGHTYIVSVRAVVSLPDIIATVRSNNSVPTTILTLPGAPTLLFVTAINSTALQASWEPGNNSLQDEFRVRYSRAGDSVMTNTTCTTSPCQFGVGGVAGQQYTVFVYAVQQGLYSASVRTDRNTAPISPTKLDGVGGVRNLRLSWEMAAGSMYSGFLLSLTNTVEGNNVSFSVNRSADNTTYTYTATNLVGGVGYFVRIFSLTATERSIDSTARLIFTLPEPVSNLLGMAVNTTALQLTWQNPISSQYRSLRLNLTSSTSGVVITNSLSMYQTTFTVAGLEPGALYTVLLVVESNVADSQPVTRAFRTKPQAPRLELIETAEDRIIVMLKGGASGVFDGILARLMEIGPELAADSGGKVTFTGLTPGTQYTLSTYTTSGNQTSGNLTRTLFTKPQPVHNLRVLVVRSTQLDVVWEGPSVGGVDNYTVTLLASHGAEQPVVKFVTARNFTFTDAHPGETYNVTVTANKGDQSSLLILQQNTTTPLPLVHVRVSLKGTDFVTIAWDVPSGTVYDGFAYDFVNVTLAPLPANSTTLRLESLVANSNYTVTLYVFSRRVDTTILYSLPTTFNFSTYPESVATLQKVNATSTTITVNWTAPVSGDFTSYLLGHKLATVNVSYTITSVPVANTNYTFQGLMAGEDYSVAIRTVLGPKNYGTPVYLEAVTKPLAVIGVAVTERSEVSLTLAWTSNINSTQDRFTVRQEKDGIIKSQLVLAVRGQTAYNLRVDQLLSGYSYAITVSAVREVETDIEESAAVTINGTTNPLSVTNLTLTAGEQLVTLTWMFGAGSRQDQYLVQYRPVLRDPATPWLTQTSVTPTSQIPAAFPGERYNVSVYAISNGQSSVAKNASTVVAPLAPNVTVVLEQTTTSSVTLTWGHDPKVTFVEFWRVRYFGPSQSDSKSIPRTSDLSYTAVLNQLTPGAIYMVEVIAIVQDVTSLKVIQNVTAKPVINTNIQELVERTRETELAFEYSVRAIDIFDNLRFWLPEAPDVEAIVKGKDDPVHEVTFTGLLGGTLYTVTAVTSSNQQVSDATTNTILTVPNNVKVAMETQASTVTVKFVSIVGRASSYRVECRTWEGSACGEEEVSAQTASMTVSNLHPYTNYNLTVTTIAAHNHHTKTKTRVYTLRTAQAAPMAVRNVKAVPDGLQKAKLSWDPPLDINGELQRYEVFYLGKYGNIQHKEDTPVVIQPTQTTVVLDQLRAGYEYTFRVRAVTVAAGAEAHFTLILPTDVPAFGAGLNAELSKPTLPTTPIIGETTLSVQLTNPFTDYNGPITSYTVIVSRQPNKDASQTPLLPSWEDAHRNTSITAYQAIGNCTKLFTDNSGCDRSTSRSRRASGDPVPTVIFQVGLQTLGECGGVLFCNGPLEADTEYYIKLRAFTASGFTDTQYSSKIKTVAAPSNSAVLIGVVVAVIVVLVIGVVIVIIIIRRKRQPRRATKYRGNGAGSTRPAWEHSSSLKNFSRPVKVSDFPEHVRRMAADSDFKYAEEYEDLKEVGRDQPCYAAELPANRPKNRFTNILPYDHSRVKLLPTDDEDGSDYINANYMPGYSSKREYMATQGPLPATRDDFWRMLWEQNSRNIVMLTRCMEKGREKSDHYWPRDSEPKFYGDLQVVVLNETHLPDWTITEFRVSLGDDSRHVRHFYYKAWPDFGVPKNHSSLIRFVHTVRDKLMKEGGPIITHCSAGVGRSGTFIVLDHVLQLIKEKDEVDIFSIVYNLRRERVLMVQTEQQYKFVHECLACVLEGREDEATYANIGQVNVGFEDDEGINVEIPS